MKIVVIGGQGMLGREICATYNADHEVISLDIDTIDVTKRTETIAILEDINPDIIVNSAVMVNVDQCEQEPDTAWAVNAIGAQNIALAAARCDSQLIYISTDYVFDGETEDDYAEYDSANPINQYGKSKYYGEILSAHVCRKLFVVRSSWLFGHSPNGYIARILAQCTAGTVRMANDQLEAPTYTAHLAHALQPLWQSGCYGIYHISGGNGCTRVDFAQAVLAAAGIDVPIEIISAADTEKSRIARRPRRIVLDCALYQRVCGLALPLWDAGITEYFQREPYQG